MHGYWPTFGLIAVDRETQRREKARRRTATYELVFRRRMGARILAEGRLTGVRTVVRHLVRGSRY